MLQQIQSCRFAKPSTDKYHLNLIQPFTIGLISQSGIGNLLLITLTSRGLTFLTTLLFTSELYYNICNSLLGFLGLDQLHLVLHMEL